MGKNKKLKHEKLELVLMPAGLHLQELMSLPPQM